jgi:hypothetical protein
LRLYKIRVRVKFTLKIFLKSGKVAAHFAVCSKPKSAGVGQVVSRESRPVSQSVGRGSPKGVSGTRATQDRYSLHAKTPPRPLGHRSPKVWGVGEASRPKASLSPGVGRGVGGQRLHLAKSVLGSRRWPVGGVGAGRRRPPPVPLWPVGGQWVASEGSGSPMGGRPLLWPVGEAVAKGGQWEAFGR